MNPLGAVDQLMLLELSRSALVAAVEQGIPEAELWAHFRDSKLGGAPVFLLPGSVFITLRRDRKLRGCVGSVGERRPLGAATVESSAAAALRDPRFTPVEASEIAHLEIELTLLGELQPMASPEQIVIGKHGVLITLGLSRGLLLPQVAEEWALQPESFLELACKKAGLPTTAWRQGARVDLFRAHHFGRRET